MTPVRDRPRPDAQAARPYASNAEARFLPLWLAMTAFAWSSSVINDTRSKGGLVR